ncbi:MAG: hypothetical protein H0U76_17695 [Ktedonobacteraceae bacterium]|nr:hypothetical protein [Ktedonobacteraceae bacterium]
MTSLIELDILLFVIALLVIGRFVWSQVSNSRWLSQYGTSISALITQVRREQARQACFVTAAWTDPRTGRRWTFRGWQLDRDYQVGQFIAIRLDPTSPSCYTLE